VVIKDCISLVISKFYTTLLKDSDRPLRMVPTTHLPSIETSLAQVVTEGSKNQALTRDTCKVVLKHSVEDLQRMHHQALRASVMRIALGSGKIVTVLDELNEVIDTVTVYLREEGDDSSLIVKCSHIVSVYVSTLLYVY
jgi:hypothetical protein